MDWFSQVAVWFDLHDRFNPNDPSYLNRVINHVLKF